MLDRKMGFLGIVSSVAIVMLMSVSMAFSQVANFGSIHGQVRDPSGAVIPAVKVTITNESSGWQRTTESNSTGVYNLLDIPSGDYTLVYEKSGFKKYSTTHVSLNAGESLTINASLEVGTSRESVTVRGAATRVNTTSANVGNTVHSRQVENIPLSSRSFTQLMALEPGVSSSQSQSPGFGSNTSVPFSFNGVGHGSSNNFLLDGGRNIEPYNGNNLAMISLDAISEISVQNNDYSAQYGRDAGALINVITKSGTNEYHGSLFEYFRNNVLDARNFFATGRPETRYNDFGGTIGGPIKKNKLFFFYSYEGRRIVESGGTRTTIVPTPAEINGNFSGSAPIINPATGQPFPGNQIGPLDPNAQLLLENYYASPTPGFHSGALNFTASNPDGTNFNENLGKINYNITPKLTFAGHYVYDSTLLTSPFGLFAGNPMPNVAASTEREDIYTVNGSLTWTPTSNFLNVLTTAYYHNSMGISTTPFAARARVPSMDIPRIFSTTTDTSALIPGINMAQGYAGIQFIWPQNIHSSILQLIDNSTWIKGRHIIKFGGELDRENKTQSQSAANNNGTFTFTGASTGNALADMLLGDAYEYTESSTHIKAPLNWNNWSLYVQDQYRVTSHLTITPGLRWELFPPENDPTGHLSYFNPTLFNFSQAATVLPNGQIVAGTQNFGNGVVVAGPNNPYGNRVTNTVYDTFEPRFGFAYALGKNDMTVLRGGYGIFGNRWSQFVAGTRKNYPFDQSVSIFNTDFSHPSVGTQAIFPESLTSFHSPWNVPTYQKWSFGFQRQLPYRTLVGVNYVGTRGTHIVQSTDINQPFPNLAVAQGTISANAVRPYAGFGPIGTYFTDATSRYNALQVSVVRQWTSGLSFQVSYTYSKAMDNETSPMNPYAPLSAEYALSPFDRTQVLTFNYVYTLPFYEKQSGWRGEALGGWRVSGITSISNGTPLTVYITGDQAGVGTTGQRPDLIAPINRPGKLNDFFSTSAFAIPPLGTFGNAGRNLLFGPGFTNFDISLSKGWTLREGTTLRYTCEFLNAFNHTQYAGVDTTLGSASVGDVVSARQPRIIQMGLHLRF